MTRWNVLIGFRIRYLGIEYTEERLDSRHTLKIDALQRAQDIIHGRAFPAIDPKPDFVTVREAYPNLGESYTDLTNGVSE